MISDNSFAPPNVGNWPSIGYHFTDNQESKNIALHQV